jgi:hypothetical protein
VGWLLGIFGNYTNDELQNLKSIHPQPLHSFSSEKIYIAAGGIPETCRCSIQKDDSSGWIACGIGIKYEDGAASIMNNNDWSSELTKKDFSRFNLNGHFAVTKWNDNKLELFTDQLGVRNIYLTKLNDCFIFSTRLDWISKLNKSVSIDWEELGARWLLVNQLLDKSILKNVERINQSGRAVFNLSPVSVQVINQLWHPDHVILQDDKDLRSTLNDFTLCGLKNDRKLSLGLSGGFDSRILLALLLSSKSKNWGLHSLNSREDPDRKIAEQISKKLNIEHFLWEYSLPSVDTILTQLKDFLGQTMLTVPASAFLNTQFYRLFYNQNKIVIDGSWGEITRRRLFVGLQLRGGKAIYNNDCAELIPFLQSGRPTFFAEDYNHLMQKNLKKHIENFCLTMPPPEDIGIDNWIDLFSLRTRLPNASAPEQARSDSEFINYMPFIQPAFLKKVFETPAEERKNSKIFHKIINDNSPVLKHFPLAKDGVIYPYSLGTVPASIYMKIKRKLRFVYHDKTIENFLNHLSDFVRDTVHSANVKSSEFYDFKRLIEITEGYYRQGNMKYARDVNWWLSFEIWRQTIHNK